MLHNVVPLHKQVELPMSFCLIVERLCKNEVLCLCSTKWKTIKTRTFSVLKVIYKKLPFHLFLCFTDMLSKNTLTSVVAAIPFSWILFRCFVLVLRRVWLTRTFSLFLWVMCLKPGQRLRTFHPSLRTALMLPQWLDHFCCSSSWGTGMDDCAYTTWYKNTHTRTHISKRIC